MKRAKLCFSLCVRKYVQSCIHAATFGTCEHHSRRTLVSLVLRKLALATSFRFFPVVLVPRSFAFRYIASPLRCYSQVYVQGGKKSLPVAIIDEFFIFDSSPAAKLILTLNFKIKFIIFFVYIVLYLL